MKLKPSEVHFLCFEGGGGKGPIYLGALKALAELEILKYSKKKKGRSEDVYRLNPFSIRGVAGTSIGSLIALLVATGHTPDEMEEVLTGNYGIETLDKVEYGKIYCEYIDVSILKGYNPNLKIEVPSTLTKGDKKCILRYTVK